MVVFSLGSAVCCPQPRPVRPTRGFPTARRVKMKATGPADRGASWATGKVPGAQILVAGVGRFTCG